MMFTLLHYHDRATMPALVEDQNDLLLIGDGAYHNPTVEPVLHHNHQIDVTLATTR